MTKKGKKKKITGSRLPKKCHLGPQNGSRSLGLEKLLKILNCTTIQETEKLKETMVAVQVELVGGHQYPPRSRFVQVLVEDIIH